MSANKAAAQPRHSQNTPASPPAPATPLGERWGAHPAHPIGGRDPGWCGSPLALPWRCWMCAGGAGHGAPLLLERRGVGELEGRKCLFQCCHSKQSAPGNFASSVFALSSCFPTIHTGFGGAQHQGWCLAFPAGAGGRKGGCIPLPSFQWP